MSIIECQLQLCLNKLQQWANDNGFQFSKTKTVSMHICQKRGLHLDPQLFLDKDPIPVVEETKFLGVIFHRKLSFVHHLKFVKKRALKALNIFKVIGNTEWGADRKVMLRLYRSLVRSKLDYGCIVYGSARKSYTDGSRDGNAVACATVFPSNTVISMRLPDSASVFTAEVWAIIKALEQIKDSIATKYIVFTDSLSCLQALQHMKLEHPLIGMVIRKCHFKYCQKRLGFFGYPAILASRAMKRLTLPPSLHWICLVPRLAYTIMILNIVSSNISFPLGKMTGMVRSRTSFILSSQSWEIGSPPTGGAGRMK